jgi:hypothetical protein
MTIINLTPHPIRVYGWTAPDQLVTDEHEPIAVYAPSGKVARLVELEIGGWTIPGMSFPIERVEYGQATGLPAPDRDSMNWYIVSLALALALPDRPELLVPYREIRNLEGTVVGCRTLARPV